MADAAQGQQPESFEDTPHGQARRWHYEVAAARKQVEQFYKEADEATSAARNDGSALDGKSRRLPLYASDVATARAILYGEAPKAAVSRRFGDANDDLARVAAEQAERALNTDIDKSGSSYATTLGYSLDERLVRGMGVARIRYEMREEDVAEKPETTDPETGAVLPAVRAHKRKAYECVETEFVYHRDFLWSAGARIWEEARWVGFRTQMGQAKLEERFGPLGKLVPLNSKPTEGSAEKDALWGRADVWELWDREAKRVVWWVEGFDQVLDTKPDPYGLPGFFPCAAPMLSNALPGTLVPRPDYALHREAYEEIDALTDRIRLLQRAVRVVGVYDASSTALRRLLDESDSRGNEMVPVESWAAFTEKGGIKGAVDWFPLKEVVEALIALRDYRSECIDKLHQVTGKADLMRGQATQAGATLGEQKMKVGFGSVRLNAMQKEFARFASELAELRLQLMCKHFAPETIVKLANTEFTADAPMALQAARFLQSDSARFRVQVRPEAVAMQDFAALRQEGTEVVQALAQYFTAAAPVAQAMPNATPYLLQILQWVMAKFKGSSTIESVLDQAIAAAQKDAAAPKPPAPPDPKVQAAQLKLQGDQAKLQGDLVKEKVKLDGDLQRLEAQTRAKAAQEWEQAQAGDWEKQRQAGRASLLRASRPGGAPGGEP